jgi:hypothetical protein
MRAGKAAERVARLPRADRPLARLVELIKLQDLVEQSIRQQLLELDAAGVTQMAIARRLRVTNQAVSNRVRRARAARAAVEGGTDGTR